MFQQNSRMSSIIGPDFEINGDINIDGILNVLDIVALVDTILNS